MASNSRIDGTNLALTVIAIAELLRRMEWLPKGKRRQKPEHNFKEFIQAGFIHFLVQSLSIGLRIPEDVCRFDDVRL